MGNQLFMYSFFLYIKKLYDVEVYFDDKYYKCDRFGRKSDISILLPNYPVYRFRFNPAGERGLKRIMYEWKQKIVPTFKYINEIDFDDKLRYEGDIYLNGFWQTDKYVNEIGSDAFIPKENPPIKLLPYLSKVNEEDIPVSIHFRRTDYFSPKYVNRYGVCTTSYYIEAMDYINSLYEKAVYYVFSDDIEWVKQNIKFQRPAVYVPNFDINPYWYIYLMSRCKHQIISNSTFSWWGAYLNKSEKKVVITPDKWTLDSSETIALKEWIKIET